MLENLEKYQARTAFMWDSLPQDGQLCTSAGLARKVNPDGSFRPFCGDTVIFSLPQDMTDWLADVQAALYDACGECLAERIAPDTFHITLHDLLSQPDSMPEGTSENLPQAQAAIGKLCAEHPYPIGIRSCCLFSMVGTSIVMGFEPSTEIDCAVLMGMYEQFQRIVPLGYPLTLHVTLAYYKPGEYRQDMLHRLRTALACIGRERRVWQLEMGELHYASFTSMAQYHLFPAADPWHLDRFVKAQTDSYACALREIQGGCKRSHWMWFIFPQLRGLGRSTFSYTYGITGLAEARAYLAHPVLGPRLVEITHALLALDASDPVRIMGKPDDLKLCSCMTLFSQLEGADPAFAAVLDRFYGGRRDARTLALLRQDKAE